jgi:hypothetical protein
VTANLRQFAERSADRDFSRFAGLAVVNPLVDAGLS